MMPGVGGRPTEGAVIHYAERKIQGIPFPQPYEGDDLFIMGGDFIVRKDGEIVFAFHQTTTVDRPDTDDLLSCLRDQPATHEF